MSHHCIFQPLLIPLTWSSVINSQLSFLYLELSLISLLLQNSWIKSSLLLLTSVRISFIYQYTASLHVISVQHQEVSQVKRCLVSRAQTCTGSRQTAQCAWVPTYSGTTAKSRSFSPEPMTRQHSWLLLWGMCSFTEKLFHNTTCLSSRDLSYNFNISGKLLPNCSNSKSILWSCKEIKG